MHDYHAHTNYSDGELLPLMVAAAAEAGLDGIGFADHCNVGDREHDRALRERFGWTMDVAHERRRRGIQRQRERGDLAIHDAVEMDYDPRDEDAIAEYLADGDFDYALGSVHAIDGTPTQFARPFAEASATELDAFVDDYYDRLVALVESELFEVAAHPDLVERAGPLAGRSTQTHYDRVAEAFASSRTVPEINAGRVLQDDGSLHPRRPFLETLLDRGLDVTVGTDAHSPDEVAPRVAALADVLDEYGVEPVSPLDVAGP